MRQAALAVVAVLCAAGAGCGGGKSAATTTTTVAGVTNPTGTASVTTHGRYHYPQVVVDNFMKSCTKGNDQRRAYCVCALDQFSNTVSVRDFARVGRSGGKVPLRIRRAIKRAAVACANKL